LIYFIKTPNWLKWVYKSCFWEIKTDEKKIFLSFDDGPHPQITPFVLEELRKYNAKATFFCIGDNVSKYPDVYKKIIDEGHMVGNHTQNHLNGWKTEDKLYLDNIAMAQKHIDSDLFRPPYGRITRFQLSQLTLLRFNLKTIMWTILSGDFDKSISKEDCRDNVILNAKEGSIVVFHDSEKARERMTFALPEVLNYFASKGYVFEKITTNIL
jgi:peptidoglycan/xylan/chitin deacetylase (PgdA/CDA1 family)